MATGSAVALIQTQSLVAKVGRRIIQEDSEGDMSSLQKTNKKSGIW